MFHVFRSTNVTMYALWVKSTRLTKPTLPCFHHPISGFSNKTRFQNKSQTGIVFKRLSWSISKYSYFSGCFQFSVCRLGVQDVECLKKSPITRWPALLRLCVRSATSSVQASCRRRRRPPPIYRKKIDPKCNNIVYILNIEKKFQKKSNSNFRHQ